MPYEIRPVRATQWREIRDLRMDALRDEAAPLAFLSTYEEESAYPDEFWIRRARTSSLDAGPAADARQFVAMSDDGRWVGTAVTLIERAGQRDFEERRIERDGAHVVGVYVRPEHRGHGLIDDLFDAALGWARERALHRARLYVHRDNARAQGAYRRLGFTATGATFTGAMGPELEMARIL
ncbi:GNAT family N-acetyltransferase [Myceligenerans pegani]|uniref:GNAT family N-acetyltransferase n=1 Tax=Myceligenerans pegani TaxID=2776917 RepID=A0ABR9MWZ0_9MICO|nr:GNAT family N-acetyltransferase [Myceligenerans sp. TRM 65318]MBE1875897.1 GNAT family N-acetyltransferase [Myceligenerans sp. TRM 65318]MBE3018168.1 GNAT family N-acetyltransferase [Myceligenerans sp. TRM 65318]